MTPNTAEDDIGMQQLGDDDIAVDVTEFRVLPAGVYPVEFIQCERMQTQFGESVKLVYRIADGAEADSIVDELASLKGGRGSKLKERLTVLRGVPYKPGETLRPRELFGRTAQAVVQVKDVTRDGETFQVNRIETLLPLSGARPAPSAPTGAARRPAPPPPPPGQFRVVSGLEEQPPADDPGWEAMQPPPA